MLQQVLNDLKESGVNETKSKAGDKHETTLAMLQIEHTQIFLNKVIGQMIEMNNLTYATDELS